MKKNLIALFVCTITSMFSQDINLLENGGFENDNSNWQTATLNDSRAYFRSEKDKAYDGDKSLKVKVERLGEQPWDIHMMQAFRSRKSATYEIKFYARANRSGKSIKAQLQNKTYTVKDFFLSPNWEEYTWITEAKESDLSLAFHFLEKGYYYLDNITIKRVRKGGNNSKPSVSKNSNSEKKSNLIANGGFEDGFDGWINLSEGNGKALYKLNRKSAYEGRASMKVNVLRKGDNPWDIQSMKELSLKKNRKYRIRFNAKSLGEKTVTIQIQDEGKKIYLANEFTTGFEWQNYAWVFEAESSNMNLVIHHVSRGTVEFDSFTIEQVK